VTHRESLEYLYGLQRFGIKLGLANIQSLLERAGEPQQAMDLIHVAGTNGKGSVCITLAALLQKAGHRTGLYTSPHLHDFSERIRVDGVPIAEERIVALTEWLKGLCGDEIPATFFEFTTAMALCHFRDSRVRWGVLETGMGGRLDATNAVRPRVSVITSIALDHAEHLGGSLEEIAAEKAGIIKQGVPVVSASHLPEVLAVLEKRATELQAPLYVYGRDVHLVKRSRGLCYEGLSQSYEGLTMPLAGEHQYENLALALAASEAAGVLPHLDRDDVAEALSGVTWPGRLEWWAGKRNVLLDGAHNVAGCRTLARYLEQQSLAKVSLLFGAKADKAAMDMLAELLPFAGNVMLTEPPVDAAAPLQPLVEQVRNAGLPVCCCRSLNEVREQLSMRDPDRILVVAGSLFLVAAVREILGEVG